MVWGRTDTLCSSSPLVQLQQFVVEWPRRRSIEIAIYLRVPFNVVTPIFSFNITAREHDLPLPLPVYNARGRVRVYVYTYIYIYIYTPPERWPFGGGWRWLKILCICILFLFIFFTRVSIYIILPNKRPPPVVRPLHRLVRGGGSRNDEDIKKPSDREARTENPFLSGWLHKHNINCEELRLRRRHNYLFGAQCLYPTVRAPPRTIYNI